MIPFELVVEQQDTWCYRVSWCDAVIAEAMEAKLANGEQIDIQDHDLLVGSLVEPDSTFLANIPDTWLDLIPYMVARRLLEQGNNPDQLLIVRLRGADFDLMRAPLGVVAATPLLNIDKPVSKPTHCIYRRELARSSE
jgi:hypothetical protein